MERNLCVNREARYNYEVEETYEAGLCLQGTEVKSCRMGRVSLKESYARFVGEELYLVDAHISPYPHAAGLNHRPDRPRKLLLHKQQLRRLLGKVSQRGLTLVPLRMYLKGRWIKLELALARGRKLFDKREELKRRAEERELRRALKLR